MERSAVAALDITQQQLGITTEPPSASPRSRSVCRPSRPPAVVPGAHAVGHPVTTLSCKEAS